MFILFFMCYFLKHSPSYLDAFDRMKLKRFVSSNSQSINKDTAISCSRRLLLMSFDIFEMLLYENVVDRRRSVEPKNRPNFQEGRETDYSKIITNLCNVLYLVDGRNQECSKKCFTGTTHVNKLFYNHKKKSSGFKSLVRVDPSGFACWMSPSLPASISDATIHKETFEDSIIPEGFFEIADGGFIGCKRCITPFKKTTINSDYYSSCFVSVQNNLSYLVFYYGNSKEEIIVEIAHSCIGKVTNNSFQGNLYGNIQRFCSKLPCFIIEQELDLKIKGKVLIENNEMLLTEIIVKDSFQMRVSNRTVEVKTKEMLRKPNQNKELLCLKLKKVEPEMLKLFNVTLSSIRILVENFFGRLNSLFKITKQSFVLDSSMYSSVNRIAVALTNCHVHFYPIRKFPFHKFHIHSCENEDKKPLSDKVIKVLENLGHLINEKDIDLNEDQIMSAFVPAPIESEEKKMEEMFVVFLIN